MSILHVIKQCKSVKQLHQVHAYTITTGLLPIYPLPILTNILSTFITTLIPTSSANSSTLLSYAISVFCFIPNPSTFCYNNLIRIHTLLSFPFHALHLFASMRHLSIPPDFHTFPFILKACAQVRELSFSQSIHSQAFKYGFLSDLFVLNSLIHAYSFSGCVNDAYKVFDESSDKDVISYNSMIDGLVKSGEMTRARELFDLMPLRDEVSWGTMIAGYAQMNWCNESIELYNQMLALQLRPCNIVLVSALSSCARLGELEQGKTIHEYINRNRIPVDSFLSTGLVDLYAKCGCMETARNIFESSPDKNLITWNAMLVGLAMHGYGSLLLAYFCRMIAAGIKPDGVTFLGVLVGCSHAGLVNEAQKLFKDMESVYGVSRDLKHYGCMADMLGRAGLIGEAIEMIYGMPIEGDIFVWGALLGGCRIHGNVEIAKRAALQIMEIKPEDGGVYSVMANIYANTEQWEDVVKTRRSISSNKRVKKITGFSSIKLTG
ncbi:Pentatricopeptide repeat-containing protein [Quillaja saponaria]|uniref:Pentatricopeptide repeat-containing protein n=1 Tax=Quillaja saponaria TaxID=32244 RepID=A0AAD7KSY0_QUISA|nr:Pentatricopeptide repeat-containing protein [Quillaja saponaria]